MVFCTICVMRSRLGMYWRSWDWGNGVSQPVTRSIGDFEAVEAMLLD